MENFLSNLFSGDSFNVITSVVATSSAIATVTPTKSDNAIVNFLRKLVHIFAFNFGEAENKDADKLSY